VAVEALWSAKELQNLGGAVAAFEELVQEWQAEYGVQVQDLMVNIETEDRPKRRLGSVTLLNYSDTTLQFEAGEFEIGVQ
jgi:hypothetical protein